MNCFQHPTEPALFACKECNKPICVECARQNVRGQTGVCSEVCAQLASLRPPPEKPDSLFNRIYASIFIVLLLGMLGGIFVVWGGQAALARKRRMDAGKWVGGRPNEFILLYYLHITDWRAQFALGAVIGMGSGLVYVRKNISWKITT
jgi:hypothetical protein